MKKLVINKIDNYNYFFSDSIKEYKINIEFYDTDYRPSVGDYLYISDNVLNSINNKMISCGPININDIKDIENELFIFICDNNKVYLKRYYG